MEIEVKYQLPNRETLEDIWISSELMELTDPSSIETVRMLAIYYDTADQRLSDAGITLRVRREGDEAFCTIKWDGKLVNGIYEREELNIPVDIEKAESVPDISVFGTAHKGREILSLTEDSKLIPLVTMDFTRRRKRLTYDRNIMELALDDGKITAAGRECPILEMELEHYAGNDPTSVLELGEITAYKYGLSLQPKSKYARGKELLKIAFEEARKQPDE